MDVVLGLARLPDGGLLGPRHPAWGQVGDLKRRKMDVGSVTHWILV